MSNQTKSRKLLLDVMVSKSFWCHILSDAADSPRAASHAAHAPDEYHVIEPSNPKIRGMDGATRSFVEYLFGLATVG